MSGIRDRDTDVLFFFKQKTAYDIVSRDWSSDVCSSDLTAQVLVQNRVSSALSQLPQAVQAQGVVVQKNSTAILQIVTLTSPDARYDSLYLANYATINLKDEIARLPGVGNVVVFGAGQYSMRIWLDPERMRARGLVPQDVIQALQQQSTQVTAGGGGGTPPPAPPHFQKKTHP